MNVLESIF